MVEKDSDSQQPAQSTGDGKEQVRQPVNSVPNPSPETKPISVPELVIQSFPMPGESGKTTRRLPDTSKDIRQQKGKK